MYKHNIMRINYTTYDVRRGDDVIHPGTSHHNIMVLNPRGPSSEHPFWYARVLGIYHINVVYTGMGTADYHPRRLEFLWVRWYEQVHDLATGWMAGSLDQVRFPPMDHEDSFGFVDPADVLRSCHIIPAFACGRLHSDNKGISKCAQDSTDWQTYYVNRCVYLRWSARHLLKYSVSFVDRDMMMRYHWGLGVGHTYAYQQASPIAEVDDNMNEEEEEDEVGGSNSGHGTAQCNVNFAFEVSGSAPPSDSSDDGDDLDPKGWDTEEDDLEDGGMRHEDDDELLALDDMYGG